MLSFLLTNWVFLLSPSARAFLNPFRVSSPRATARLRTFACSSSLRFYIRLAAELTSLLAQDPFVLASAVLKYSKSPGCLSFPSSSWRLPKSSMSFWLQANPSAPARSFTHVAMVTHLGCSSSNSLQCPPFYSFFELLILWFSFLMVTGPNVGSKAVI